MLFYRRIFFIEEVSIHFKYQIKRISSLRLTTLNKKLLLKLTAAFLAIAIVVPVVFARYVGTHTITSTVNCNKCHANIAAEQAASTVSVHKTMSCTSCHKYTNIHSAAYQNASATMCSCHSSEISAWKTGAHKGVECWQCHTMWNGTRAKY